jgi:acetate kinase
VACFDTAFHATIPEAAATFALPAEWRARWTLRRYGFHGLSHAYVSRRAAELVAHPTPDAPAGLRVVTCHLGAGASLAAVHSGRSVDTTMGFTPLDGLVMATRSGSVDPGLVLWLEEHAHMPPRELASALENRSGLAGLAGTGDMREVLDRATAGDQRAVLGRDVYLHRLRASVAAMAAAMDGLDVLVFTGGVGENSAEIRARAANGLAFLGVAVEEARNTLGAEARGARGEGDDWEITAPGTAARTFVIAAREDKRIAADVHALLG